jgi:hypothetical protein
MFTIAPWHTKVYRKSLLRYIVVKIFTLPQARSVRTGPVHAKVYLLPRKTAKVCKYALEEISYIGHSGSE